MAKADLHVHSKHSNRPSEWLLRQLRAPESFTEPREIYRRCRERGMDFVTISDHDTIDGGLEILHLPGTFLSCEVTVEFPEDGCEIHEQLARKGFDTGRMRQAGGVAARPAPTPPTPPTSPMSAAVWPAPDLDWALEEAQIAAVGEGA